MIQPLPSYQLWPHKRLCDRLKAASASVDVFHALTASPDAHIKVLHKIAGTHSPCKGYGEHGTYRRSRARDNEQKSRFDRFILNCRCDRCYRQTNHRSGEAALRAGVSQVLRRVRAREQRPSELHEPKRPIVAACMYRGPHRCRRSFSKRGRTSKKERQIVSRSLIVSRFFVRAEPGMRSEVGDIFRFLSHGRATSAVGARHERFWAAPSLVGWCSASQIVTNHAAQNGLGVMR